MTFEELAQQSGLRVGPEDVGFTQYLRPNGRQRATVIARSPEIVAMARQLRAEGFHFDIEELSDGTVSMTVEPDGEDEGPLAIQQCPNGPQVPDTVDELIRVAFARLTLKPVLEER